jgi:hypothetical protein
MPPRDDEESGEVRIFCLPTFECFLRRRFDLGLSFVDAEEPETKDGVRAGSDTMGREDARGLDVAGAFGFLVWLGGAGSSSSRRSSCPTIRRTPLEEGDLEFMAGGSGPFRADGRFFSNLDGELVEVFESAGEITLRDGSLLDGFCIGSTAGDTTRLDPPFGGLGGAITAACFVQL